MTERAAAIRLKARTVARARSEESRQERWRDWAGAALDERARAEFDAAEGKDVTERMALLDESFDIACGTDDRNALVTAARFIFDAEVVQ